MYQIYPYRSSVHIRSDKLQMNTLRLWILLNFVNLTAEGAWHLITLMLSIFAEMWRMARCKPPMTLLKRIKTVYQSIRLPLNDRVRCLASKAKVTSPFVHFDRYRVTIHVSVRGKMNLSLCSSFTVTSFFGNVYYGNFLSNHHEIAKLFRSRHWIDIDDCGLASIPYSWETIIAKYSIYMLCFINLP